MNNFENDLTFYLFARTSFIQGIGRIIDFGRGYSIYNYSKNGEDADRRAIANDWLMVGRDIESSLNQYGSQK